MKPGRDLDALVAEKVMGWEIGALNGRRNVSPCGSKWSTERDSLEGVPEYSADIAAAWEVVEATDILYQYDLWKEDKWKIGFRNSVTLLTEDLVAEADTAELAICLAALKVKGVEV